MIEIGDKEEREAFLRSPAKPIHDNQCVHVSETLLSPGRRRSVGFRNLEP